MNYFLEDPTIGKAAQLKKMETQLTGKTVDPLPAENLTVTTEPVQPTKPSPSLIDEFKALPYEARKGIQDNVIYDSQGYALIPSVNDKRLSKFEKMKITRNELESIPKYGATGSTLSKFDSTYTGGVSDLSTKQLQDKLYSAKTAAESNKYALELKRRSGDVGAISEPAREQYMNLEDMQGRMKKQGIGPLDQYMGTQQEDYDPNVADTFSKSLQRSWQEAKKSLLSTLESSDVAFLSGWAGERADKVRAEIVKSPNLNLSTRVKTSFLEGGATDPNYYAMVAGQLMPHVAGSLAASLAGGVAGPTGALAGAFGYSYGQEAGNVYSDLLEEGISKRKAKLGSALYGAVAAAADSIIPAKTANKILGNTATQALREGIKESAFQVIARNAKEGALGALTEGSTEAFQQLAQNVVENFFLGDIDITRGVVDSFVGGLVGGGIFEATGTIMSKNTEGQGDGSDTNTGSPTLQNMKEKKEALEATVDVTKRLIEQFPTNTKLPDILAKAEEELVSVSAGYANTLNQHLNDTKVSEVKTPNLEVDTAQVAKDQWVAQGKAIVQGIGLDIPFSTSEIFATPEEAVSSVSSQIQSWLESQMKNPTTDDITGLASIDASLQELLARPVTANVVQDSEKALDAQDMSEAEFLTKYAKTGDEINSMTSFYRKANKIHVQKELKKQAEKPIRELAHDLGIQVKWVDHIATVEGRRALGSFQKDTIKLLQNPDGSPVADEATVYHEVGHAYFRKVMAPEQRREVLDQVKEKHGIKDDSAAEEVLVEDLKKYVDAKEKDTSTYGKFLGKLVNTIKKLVNFVKGDKISQFYEDVVSKKRPKDRVEFTKAEMEDRATQAEMDKKELEQKTLQDLKDKEGIDLSLFVKEDEKFRLENIDEKLVGIHNLSESKLRHALKLGGLPVPSIAITKLGQDYTNFGAISLIPKKTVIDPKNRTSKVFNADVYSPRYPNIEYAVENGEILSPIFKKLEGYFTNEDKIPKWSGLNDINIYDIISSINDQGFDGLYNSKYTKALFAKENDIGKDSSISDINDYVDANKKTYYEFVSNIYNKLVVKEKIFKGYTYSGNRRYASHTLANVTKEMLGNIKGGEGFNYGVPSIRSVIAKKFKSLEDIASNRGTIISKSEMESIKDSFDRKYNDLLDKHNIDDIARFTDNFVGYLKGEDTLSTLQQYPSTKGVDMSDFIEFAQELKEAPTQYFEAKIQRSVSFEEFSTAVVPTGTAQEIIDGLESYGVNVYTYDPDVSADRKDTIKNLAEEGNIEVFRLEGNNVSQEDKAKIDVLGKALTGSTAVELNEKTLPRFQDLVAYSIKLNTYLQNTYGEGLSDGAKQEVAAIQERIKSFSPVETMSQASNNKYAKTQELVSRVSERMKERYPELIDEQTYMRMNMEDEIDKALSLVRKDQVKAYRTAMGIDGNSAHQQTAVNIALSEKALADGNYMLANQLIKQRSLRQTDYGQSIVLENASINDNSPQKYITELLNTRYANLALKIKPSDIDVKLKRTPAERVQEIVGVKVQEAKRAISEKKRFDLKQAQDFISSLACS